VCVHTSISQAAVKGFNTGILHRLARANKVELHTPPIGPIFERPRLELGAMIHRDRAWPLVSRSAAGFRMSGEMVGPGEPHVI
jgi:hypothetical protein